MPIKIIHSFNERCARIDIIDDDNNEYLVKFFYFSNMIYETIILGNSWAQTNTKANSIKVYNSNNLIFEKNLEQKYLSINEFCSNENLIRTIPNEDFSIIHSRSLIHNGCIVDLGCLNWDWSSYFINKKRVIGVDPFEDIIEGVEIFKGIIGSFDGKSFISDKGLGSSVFLENNEYAIEFPVLSWKNFCKQFNINNISILKINIEGSEYPLLNSLDIQDYKKIDQICISFHDWINPNWSELTKTALQLLENNGFDIIKIDHTYNWYLALNKNLNE